MPQDILLVNMSGRNRPQLLASLSQMLASHGVRILDIGEAVIHDELSLGLLLQVPAGAGTGRSTITQVLEQLAAQAAEQGAALRCTPISAAEYARWVGQQGQPRFIITLLANGISAAQFAAVAALVAQHGLTVDGVRRLSGRVPLTASASATRASVELRLRGELADPLALKTRLLEAASSLDFDFSIQEDNVYRRNRRLVAFDMDSTLIKAEVIDELARLHGVGADVAAITERAMRGEIDFQTSFRQRVALLKGLSADALAQVASSVALTDGAHRLVATLKHFGYRTAIISGGFTQVGARLQQTLGIDYVFANELDIVNGCASGEVKGEIVDAERKAALLREICQRERIELAQAIAIGDGANDLPMLSAAGLGVAFHAKPLVRASANHAISNFGLDAVLYLIGFSDRDLAHLDEAEQP